MIKMLNILHNNNGIENVCFWQFSTAAATHLLVNVRLFCRRRLTEKIKILIF